MSRFFVAVERITRYTGDTRRVEVRAEVQGMTFYRQAIVTDHEEEPATTSMYMQAISRMFHEIMMEAQSREDKNGLR
jgi:hypothetical protein